MVILKKKRLRLNSRGKKALSKLVASVFTFSILLIIVFMGPAEAYTLSLTSSSINVDAGAQISFEATLKIDNQELLNVSYFVLRLTSLNTSIPEVICNFNPDGTIIGSCPGIQIIPVSSIPWGYGYGYDGYGYGYGYGYGTGEFKYNIIFNTTYTTSYNTYLSFVTGSGQTFETTGNTIIVGNLTGGATVLKNIWDINVGESIMNKNIRGKYGNLDVGNLSFEVNKLIFTARSKGANRGNGYITGQKDKTRFSYKFKVMGVEETDELAKIYVTGKYRVGRGEIIILNTFMMLDKSKGELSLTSEPFSLNPMEVIYNDWNCRF